MDESLKLKVEAVKGDQSGLDDAVAGVNKLKGATDKGATADKAAGEAAAQSATKKRQLLDAVGKLAGQVPGLGGAFASLKIILSGLSFAGIIGGLAFLIQIGTVVYSKFFAPMIEGIAKTKTAIKTFIGEISSLVSVLTGLDAGIGRINNMANAMDAAAKATKLLADAQKELRAANFEKTISVLNQNEAAELSKPGQTEDQREAIRSKFEGRRQTAKRNFDSNELAIRGKQIDGDIENARLPKNKASAEVFAIEQAIKKAAKILTDEVTKGRAGGIQSDQDKTIFEAAKARTLDQKNAFEKTYGIRPEEATKRAAAAMNSGNITFAEANEENKSIRDAVDAYRGLNEKLAAAKAGLEALAISSDAAVSVLEQERNTLKIKKDAIDIQANTVDPSGIIKSDAKNQAAVQAAAAAKGSEAALERAKIIAAAKEAAKEAAKANKASGPSAPDATGQSEGSPESGFDEFLTANAKASKGGLVRSKRADRFRKRLTGSEAQGLGDSFSERLIDGKFMRRGENKRLSPEEKAEKLWQEQVTILREIRDKIGMRE